MTKRFVPGVLLLYNHPPITVRAPTILEHVRAFTRHSRFPVWSLNTEMGFPKGLRQREFAAVVFHYSLFGDVYAMGNEFLKYLRDSSAFKVAFFQDEHHYCRQRFRFLDQFGVDAVYTLLAPQYHDAVYGAHTKVATVRTTLTGYVSEEVVVAAEKWGKPAGRRLIDVGYRARPLPFFMGRGAQEKYWIGEEFRRHAKGWGLRLDIDAREEARLYGTDWHRFLGNLHGVLGVEAGVSIFDLDDTVRTACERLLVEQPDLSFAEVSANVLDAYEDNIPYRTISPRHFEAAAFEVCQILFEGAYQGVLEAGVHYLPLKKDFSNFEEVVRMFRDGEVRRAVTERAQQDLILSGAYSYARFIERFDADLEGAGLELGVISAERRRVSSMLYAGHVWKHAVARARVVQFPGKSIVKWFATPLRKRLNAAEPKISRFGGVDW